MLAARLVRVRPVKVELLENVLVLVQRAANQERLVFPSAELDHGRGAGVLDPRHADRFPVAVVLERLDVVQIVRVPGADGDGRLHGGHGEQCVRRTANWIWNGD